MSGGHHHPHSDSAATGKRLGAMLALVTLYMVAELVGGLVSNSLALLADAGHMLSDAGALLVSLYATLVARRPPTATHTFGYRRAEILAALINGAALLAIAGYILFEALHRIGSPPQVRGGLMLAVAAGGLIVNLVGLVVLHGGKSDNLNVRSAWLHVFTDTLGSLGAIISGILIATLNWHWADPIASIVIAILVLYSAWNLLTQTVAVLMQAVPPHIDLVSVERVMTAVDGVLDVHDLHIWSVTSGRDVMSAHVAVVPDADQQRIVDDIDRHLRNQFDLHHATIQLNCPAECTPCTPQSGCHPRARSLRSTAGPE